jgi:hypothetical protein
VSVEQITKAMGGFNVNVADQKSWILLTHCEIVDVFVGCHGTTAECCLRIFVSFVLFFGAEIEMVSIQRTTFTVENASRECCRFPILY